MPRTTASKIPTDTGIASRSLPARDHSLPVAARRHWRPLMPKAPSEVSWRGHPCISGKHQ